MNWDAATLAEARPALEEANAALLKFLREIRELTESNQSLLLTIRGLKNDLLLARRVIEDKEKQLIILTARQDGLEQPEDMQ